MGFSTHAVLSVTRPHVSLPLCQMFGSFANPTALCQAFPGPLSAYSPASVQFL